MYIGYTVASLTYEYWIVKVLGCGIEVDHMDCSADGLPMFHHVATVGGLYNIQDEVTCTWLIRKAECMYTFLYQ